jgi:VanZ family protein
MNNPKWLFTFGGVIALVHGIGDLFFTEFFISIYDSKTDATGMNLAHFLGMTNITLGLVIFALRDQTDRAIIRKVSAGAAVGLFMGIFVTVEAVLTGGLTPRR